MEAKKTANKILEMIDEGIFNPRAIALMCLKWMSDDDIAEMAKANDLDLEFEDETEEPAPPPLYIARLFYIYARVIFHYIPKQRPTKHSDTARKTSTAHANKADEKPSGSTQKCHIKNSKIVYYLLISYYVRPLLIF